MPYSSDAFDAHIESFLRVLKPNTVLDVGVGAGKYGDMIRRSSPFTRITGIEIDPEYIERFKLREKYDEIYQMDTVDIITPNWYNRPFDLVIIGDAIEHLRKSIGLDLINFLIYRTRWVLVQFPHKYLQNIWEGHTSEAHISAWSEHDFTTFEHTKLYQRDTQRLILLRGYLEEQISIAQIEKFLEARSPAKSF